MHKISKPTLDWDHFSVFTISLSRPNWKNKNVWPDNAVYWGTDRLPDAQSAPTIDQAVNPSHPIWSKVSSSSGRRNRWWGWSCYAARNDVNGAAIPRFGCCSCCGLTGASNLRRPNRNLHSWPDYQRDYGGSWAGARCDCGSAELSSSFAPEAYALECRCLVWALFAHLYSCCLLSNPARQ